MMLTMPLSAVVLIGAAVLVAVVVTLLSGRWRPEQSDERDSDSRGFIGAVLSGLFVVALAFYVVIIWEDASSAEDSAAAEAAALVDTYWQLDAAPEPQRENLRALVRDYTASVVNQEWPALGNGEAHEPTGDLLTKLHDGINQLPTTPDQVKGARDRAMDRMREITDKRRVRIDQAGGLDATGQLTLTGTLVGALGMVLFPLLIGFTAKPRHVVLIGVMAGVLGLTCYLMLDVTQPFAGWIKVEPSAFQSAGEELLKIP